MMEIYLKNILLFTLIVLVIALCVAVIQIILMLLDLRWVSHEIKKRVKKVTDIYDIVAVFSSKSAKILMKRLQKIFEILFKKYIGGDDNEKAD